MTTDPVPLSAARSTTERERIGNLVAQFAAGFHAADEMPDLILATLDEARATPSGDAALVCLNCNGSGSTVIDGAHRPCRWDHETVRVVIHDAIYCSGAHEDNLGECQKAAAALRSVSADSTAGLRLVFLDALRCAECGRPIAPTGWYHTGLPPADMLDHFAEPDDRAALSDTPGDTA